MLCFSWVCEFKHTGAIPHFNKNQLMSLPVKQFNTSFTVSTYIVVLSDAMSLLMVIYVYSNAE